MKACIKQALLKLLAWRASSLQAHLLIHICLRICLLIPILLVASFSIFFLLRLGGGDPVSQYLTLSNLPNTPELIQQIRADFGLDAPIFTQYLSWLHRAIMLDFGHSFMSGRAVSEDFFALLPTTLTLVGCGLVLIIICASVFGTLSALYKDKLPDICISVMCFIGVCMPNFWLSFMLVWVFAITLGFLPAIWDDSARSLILPSISIAFMSLCMATRLLRTSMLEARDARHVLYAKIRQIPASIITCKHIFTNAIIPIIAMIGMHIGELLGGALIVEGIFAVPGIGLYCIQAFLNHDYPIIQCFVLVVCVVFTLANLLVDVLCAWLNRQITL